MAAAHSAAGRERGGKRTKNAEEEGTGVVMAKLQESRQELLKMLLNPMGMSRGLAEAFEFRGGWVVEYPHVAQGACGEAAGAQPTPSIPETLDIFSSALPVSWERGVRSELKRWRLNHVPGQPVPMLDNPFSEEKFPNIQSKPPLAVVESDEVSPQPPFLQAKKPQIPQLLLIRLLLQTLPQLRCPSLNSLQPLNVSLVVGGPTLNTAFEVQPHQCRVQEHDHFPSPAGHAIFDTSQDAIGFLGHLGTLLAHIQGAVNQHPQVLLCWAAFQPLFPKPVALHVVAVTQVQDLALGLVKPHTIGPSPWIQPVRVPLQSLPPLKQINTPAQLGVVCKLTEGALDPFVQIIDKDIKQDWPNTEPWGTPLVTGHQLE
ncbi:hypothetical protein QYF61_010384 [Mycteria americana]|uniref:Uncharacterized protein n=1 Tax=Mycteria americana TaxID=33587 RepID=A0AAN7MQI7_MYCAM|nr:hypothetical protein QYF61_010384 [Mycteria americana]